MQLNQRVTSLEAIISYYMQLRKTFKKTLQCVQLAELPFKDSSPTNAQNMQKAAQKI